MRCEGRRVARGALPIAFCLLLAALQASAAGQGLPPITPEQVRAAIDTLGDLDYFTRMNAARTVRRAPPSTAVPALIQAVSEHADGYVRFRALVLLTGFNDPRAKDSMAQALADPNDRLREVAYGYLEHHLDPQLVPTLLNALDRETAEFVRPALIRALAALGSEPRVRDTLLMEVGRGQDFFRGAVIEALGDYRAQYAVQALIGIARNDGPLQDDAVLALGRIGDRRALETLAALQRTAPRDGQPAIAAAICMLGVNCSSHVSYLAKTLAFAEHNPGYQELLRSAATGLGAIAVAGNAEAFTTLLDVGLPSQDPVRAPLALAVATVALRNTALATSALEIHPERDRAIELLREGFDMLEEHLEEERFFATVRRAYWQAPEGSPSRKLAEALIQKLEF